MSTWREPFPQWALSEVEDRVTAQTELPPLPPHAPHAPPRTPPLSPHTTPHRRWTRDEPTPKSDTEHAVLKKQTSNNLTSFALPALPPSRAPHTARRRPSHHLHPVFAGVTGIVPRDRSRSRTRTPTLESATNAGGAPPRHASEPTYGELVSLSALRKVPGHLGRECQPSWLGRRGRVRTKKVAARVCTRRAPSHTVQSCVSGPFGALEPNGAYSGGAPHPRWRQVNLDSISVGAHGLGAKLRLATAPLGAPLPTTL